MGNLVHRKMFNFFTENWHNFYELFKGAIEKTSFEPLAGSHCEVYQKDQYVIVISKAYGIVEITDLVNGEVKRVLNDGFEGEEEDLSYIIDILVKNREAN